MDRRDDEKRWPTLSGVPTEERTSKSTQPTTRTTSTTSTRTSSQTTRSSRGTQTRSTETRSPRSGQKSPRYTGGVAERERGEQRRKSHSQLVAERQEREEAELKQLRMKQYAIIGGLILALLVVTTIVIAILAGNVNRRRIQNTPSTEVSVMTTENASSAATQTSAEAEGIDLAAISMPDYVTIDYITPNEFSRPQKPLTKVNNIVVHYVGNPNTTAQNNVNYFKNLANQNAEDENTTAASSHFVIGLEGEIINCIPLNEISYCSNNRNSDTIAIEVCHPDETGKFNDTTYTSLIRLLTYLCAELDLNEEDIIRHYDVTGKICPKYYVENPEAFEQMKMDVKVSLEAYLQEQ